MPRPGVDLAGRGSARQLWIRYRGRSCVGPRTHPTRLDHPRLPRGRPAPRVPGPGMTLRGGGRARPHVSIAASVAVVGALTWVVVPAWAAPPASAAPSIGISPAVLTFDGALPGVADERSIELFTNAPAPT